MAGFYVELNQSVVSEAGQNSASVSLIIKPDNTLLWPSCLIGPDTSKHSLLTQELLILGALMANYMSDESIPIPEEVTSFSFLNSMLLIKINKKRRHQWYFKADPQLKLEIFWSDLFVCFHHRQKVEQRKITQMFAFIFITAQCLFVFQLGWKFSLSFYTIGQQYFFQQKTGFRFLVFDRSQGRWSEVWSWHKAGLRSSDWWWPQWRISPGDSLYLSNATV